MERQIKEPPFSFISFGWNPSIVTIGTVKTVKTFFLAFPALNSTAMIKKLKYSISYPIKQDFHTHFPSDIIILIGYEIEYSCFLIIVVLFSAGNVKKTELLKIDRFSTTHKIGIHSSDRRNGLL